MKWLRSLLLAWLIKMAGMPADLIAQDDWKHIRTEDGIEISFRKEENSSFYELKATTDMATDVHALVAVLKDPGNYENWMHRAANTQLLDSISPTEYVYYLQTELPWPARDKDMVVQTTITPRPDGSVGTISRNIKGYVPPKDDMQRVRFMRVKWRFIPASSGDVFVEYYTKFDPGINVPGWLEKQLLQVSPYKTLSNLTRQVKQPRYKNRYFSFLEQ